MPYEVRVIESERGWGSRVDSVKKFSTDQEATEFVKEFNSKNNKNYVPDWYMYAEDPILIE